MKYKLEWEFKAKGLDSILFSSDFLDGEHALHAADELEKTGRSGEISFIDEIGTSWSMKEMRKLLAEVEEEPHDLTVYFDGGFDSHHVKAGLGAIIYFKQGKKKYRLRANEVFDELENNNEAEYAALYFALTILEEMGVKNMTCEIKGDSQVVLKQLEGEWPCYEETLNRWLDRIENKIKELGLHPRYNAVGRKENKEADKLATQALEGKMIHSKMQIL
ncbi:reverse transcriptase-like protein [Mesobacillus subterraneus]|uniref:Reverse transcriptase-like protein n=1 Tax=Mesobacillus subterraneus TaxID=285983 RepID=A0A427TQB5_9BACI|nr:reverse transcriptase-like protein [Mesobacillus subterraneus]RSD26565.1 reverse transcriptase-like protein [Mesobacillus subterraneus]